jgi:hypothetical protein
MAVVAEEVVRKIIQQLAGVHVSPEQAALLKKSIDAATDWSADCPCAKCRLPASNQTHVRV